MNEVRQQILTVLREYADEWNVATRYDHTNGYLYFDCKLFGDTYFSIIWDTIHSVYLVEGLDICMEMIYDIFASIGASNLTVEDVLKHIKKCQSCYADYTDVSMELQNIINWINIHMKDGE